MNKKRLRYKLSAAKIAAELGVEINLDSWEDIWAFLEQHEEPEYLYFIGSNEGSEIKIGRSVHPGQRLKTIQTGYPYQLYVFAYLRHKSPFTEKEVFQKFKHLRIKGEWFKYTPELKEFVATIKDTLKAR